MEVEERQQDPVDGPDTLPEESPEANPEGSEEMQMEEEEEVGGAVNLKEMADDYAKYLIVNSKQDVSGGFMLVLCVGTS